MRIPILREPVDTLSVGPSTLKSVAAPLHPVQMIQAHVRLESFESLCPGACSLGAATGGVYLFHLLFVLEIGMEIE